MLMEQVLLPNTSHPTKPSLVSSRREKNWYILSVERVALKICPAWAVKYHMSDAFVVSPYAARPEWINSLGNFGRISDVDEGRTATGGGGGVTVSAAGAG